MKIFHSYINNKSEVSSLSKCCENKAARVIKFADNLMFHSEKSNRTF